MQVLREYKGSNSSSKNVLGKGKTENEDNSVVLLKVIPYPTLLFESTEGMIDWWLADNLLYPIKALKKYKLADIKTFEPVVTRSSISEDMMKESSSVIYVGNSGSNSDAATAIPTPLTSSSMEYDNMMIIMFRRINNEENTSEIEILRKENRMIVFSYWNVEKWQAIAEKLYQQVLSKDNGMEEE